MIGKKWLEFELRNSMWFECASTSNLMPFFTSDQTYVLISQIGQKFMEKNFNFSDTVVVFGLFWVQKAKKVPRQQL